jgi:hypothetical protein
MCAGFALMQLAAPLQAEAVHDHSPQLMLLLRSAQEGELAPSRTGQALDAATDCGKADLACYHYLGDMRLEFVLRRGAEEGLRELSRSEFDAMRLAPQQGTQMAMQNIKREFGEAEIRRANGGLLLLQCKSPEFSASYLLDQELWNTLLKQAPEGLVAAVPRRGAVLFAPLADKKSVERLSKLVPDLYAGAAQQQVSAALYLYKDQRWSLYQSPNQTQTQPPGNKE